MIKYALGLDPTKRAALGQFPNGTLTSIGASKHLTLTVPRRDRRTDVGYIAEVSSDLLTWNSGPGHTVTLQDSDSLLIVSDATPLAGTARRFIRLKVREN